MSSHRSPIRVVVIGAGIIGASISFRLAARGAAVTVVDAGDPGQGASAVSFAWINARDKNPRAYHDLNRRSLDMWDRFARALGGNVGLTWGGELRWAATPAGAAEFSERVRLLQAWGYPIQFLDETGVRQMEPGLRTGSIAAGSLSTADGHVDTGRVIDACLARATAMGAQVLSHTEVTGFDLAPPDKDSSRRVRALVTVGGRLPCDVAVLAVGADSPEVAALAGISVPLRHTFGATIITEQVAPIFSRAAVVQTASDAQPQVYFRQLADGRVMIHGGDSATESGSAGKNDAEVQQLIAAAARILPALATASVEEVRRGRRPVPQDGHPIVGFTTKVPNLYLATMHSGVTLSALISEWVASEIVDGARIDLLAPFRPQRFRASPG